MSDIFQTAKQFVIKLAGLLTYPQHNLKDMVDFSMSAFEHWQRSDTLKTEVSQDFSIDLANLPPKYNVGASDSLTLKCEFVATTNIISITGLIEFNKKIITLEVYSPLPTHRDQKMEVYNKIYSTLEHELRHFIQLAIAGGDIKRMHNQVKRRDSEDIYWRTGNTSFYDYIANEEGGYEKDPNLVKSMLRDIELQTWLGGAVREFLQKYNYKPTKAQAGIWTGASGWNPRMHNFFIALWANAPDRWKYAAKEFYKAVESYFVD